MMIQGKAFAELLEHDLFDRVDRDLMHKADDVSTLAALSIAISMKKIAERLIMLSVRDEQRR